MSDPLVGVEAVEEKQRAAEREVRHGNFRGALAIFKELAEADPGNALFAARIATLEAGLQPMELVHPKAAAGAAARPMTNDLQEGEAAANIEDFGTAVACYERRGFSSEDFALFHPGGRLGRYCVGGVAVLFTKLAQAGGGAVG